MATFTAFYDANVLYPAEMRNLLMHLALTGLFRAKWSADVHAEWICALLEKRRDLTRGKLERTRALMDLHAGDVLAAAIRGHASVIVTMNLRDFPADVLWKFGIEAQHPDEFILHLLDLSPRLVIAAAEAHRQSLPRTAATLRGATGQADTSELHPGPD